MRRRITGKFKKILCIAWRWSIVFLLLMLTPFCLPGAAQRSQPHLDIQRLKSAYTPHGRSTKITFSERKWSPDGRHAFYTVSEDPIPGTGGSWNTLFAVRRDGSHIQPLLRWQHPGEDHPDEDTLQWSSDSRRIVLLLLNFYPASSVNADGVKLLDLDPETGKQRELSRAITGKPDTGGILWQPRHYAFSPNGKYLLMTLGDGRQEITNKCIVRMDCATGKRTWLTSPSMASFSAHWSPDGKRIAYIALPDTGGWHSVSTYEQQLKHQRLYIMAADGSHKRRLTKDMGYFEEEPSWSGDGQTLTFVRRKLTKDQPRSLWTIRPDGTGLKLLRALPQESE